MVTTAGMVSATVSSPESTSRVTVAVSPSMAIEEAKVPWDQPSRAASIWPVWLQSSSMACLPSRIMPGSSRAATAASSLATASGSRVSSVTIWMARSAPMARPVRSVSLAGPGPAETSTTSSATPCSAMRTASSTAISQNGFMAILTLAVSTPLPSWRTLTLILASMTRLTATRIFIFLLPGASQICRGKVVPVAGPVNGPGAQRLAPGRHRMSGPSPSLTWRASTKRWSDRRLM